MYTHSYLGLGLMAARKAILSHRHADNVTKLTSACVNPFISGKKWSYGGVEYSVGGARNLKNVNSNDPKVDFEECEKIISDYIYLKVIPLPELDSKLINAFSYYYDRAVEVGLIGKLYFIFGVLVAQKAFGIFTLGNFGTILLPK